MIAENRGMHATQLAPTNIVTFSEVDGLRVKNNADAIARYREAIRAGDAAGVRKAAAAHDPPFTGQQIADDLGAWQQHVAATSRAATFDPVTARARAIEDAAAEEKSCRASLARAVKKLPTDRLLIAIRAMKADGAVGLGPASYQEILNSETSEFKRQNCIARLQSSISLRQNDLTLCLQIARAHPRLFPAKN
jgi:hypothetical protein